MPPVNAFAEGNIFTSLMNYSQFMGGCFWGLSAAHLEGARINAMTARYTDDSLADDLAPVSADTPDVRERCRGPGR